MATKEEISMVGFEIVAYAGDAQTDLLAALDAAREGDFEKAEQLHKDASDALIGAHDTQTKLLSQEAGGGEMEMTFIMAHAQDTLMTTMILEKQTRFTIDAYKRIAELDKQIEDLDLSVRSYNCLKRAGIHSVRQLVEFSENDLLNIRNFGAKSIEEVKDKLISMDLNLKQ